MKSLSNFYILILLIFNFFCNKSDKLKIDFKTEEADSLIVNDSIWTPADIDLAWVYDEEKDSLIRNQNLISDTLSFEQINDKLNEKYAPNIQVTLLKKSNDTLYVKIKDAMYLTQQMGSTGANAFFKEYTYNITEDPNIKYVNFHFEEGDHAGPGVYERN